MKIPLPETHFNHTNNQINHTIYRSKKKKKTIQFDQLSKEHIVPRTWWPRESWIAVRQMSPAFFPGQTASTESPYASNA